MRKTALIPMFLALAVTGAGAAQAAKGTPTEQLAKALAGRTAGTPVSCIQNIGIDSSQIIDNTAILYTMRDGTIFLNRPASGATELRSWYTLVTDTHSNQLCNVDTVRLFDTSLRMPVGWVGLGQFVPYPRAPRPKG